MKPYIELDTGEMGYDLGGNMTMDADGSMNIKVGDNMVVDVETGAVHVTAPFSTDDEVDN